MRPNPILPQALYGHDSSRILDAVPGFAMRARRSVLCEPWQRRALWCAHTNWSIGTTDPPLHVAYLCPKPGVPGFYLRSRVASRSKPLGWEPVLPARFSSSIRSSSSSSSSCCLDWRPADPINARAIAPPASETGALRPLTDSKRDCGPQSLPACGALVSRQDRPARVDTTRLHRIESDRSRSDNRGSK